ncbi:MAG: hypothetical protein OXN27_04095 [Candidatus Poribacteria bacterium]|nr:hypothetical protein [Candidatus Poribacteria bacterium]
MSKEKRSEVTNPRTAEPSQGNDRLAAEVLILSEQGKTDAEISTLLRIDTSRVPRFLIHGKLLPDHLMAVYRERFDASLSAADAAEDTPASTSETLLSEEEQSLTERQQLAGQNARLSALESAHARPKTQPIEKTQPARDASHIETAILDYIAEFDPDEEIDRGEVIDIFEDEYGKKNVSSAFQKLCSEGRILQITEHDPGDGQNRILFKYNPNFMTKVELASELNAGFAEYFKNLPPATPVTLSDIRVVVDERGLVMHNKRMFSKALRRFATENNIHREPADPQTDTEELFYK